MKKALFSPIIMAFLTLFILVIIPNSWIERLIPKQRVSQAATELNPLMFQGKYIQTKMLQDHRYLPYTVLLNYQGLMNSTLPITLKKIELDSLLF